MSDKGFGDPPGRNVLKNPLLSTAVTGLSIEDLSHNAVLLPVVRNQDLITGRDQSSGPQNRALGHTDPNIPNIALADTNSNVTPSMVTPSVTPNVPPPKKDEHPPKINYPPTSNVSKASVKSEDDFDVNEYFARLQGTRYVSAPLNSLLNEDRNVNLEATEENLEEINLNEPEKNVAETQSITADIAQNFSQLPTVLPQVASAVFSSFSNMLSMKRDPTPDPKPFRSEVNTHAQEINVPLMGVDEPVKDVAPPPREPPIGGTSSYRITTRKKAYAQIPGLSSRDGAANAYTLSQSHAQPYFTPNPNATDIQRPLGVINDELKHTVIDNKQKEYDMFNPVTESTFNIEGNVQASNQSSYFNQVTNMSDVQTNINNQQSKQANLFTPNVDSARNEENVIPANYYAQLDPTILNPLITEASNEFVAKEIEPKPEGIAQNVYASITQPIMPIIPPPPMFSNLTRRDGPSGVGKSILPPSVARRISANQPIIKHQTVQPPIATGNIFVPTIDNTDPVGMKAREDNTPMNTELGITSVDQRDLSLLPRSNEMSVIATDGSSFIQTSTHSTLEFPSITYQSPISTIFSPPSQPIANPETFLGFQAVSPISTILSPIAPPLAATESQIGFSSLNTSFVPTSSLPPSSITPSFNEPSVSAPLPPPPTKPIGPPSKSTSSIFKTAPKANLPPPPTNIFTPTFPAEDSQTIAANVPMMSNIPSQASVPSFLPLPPKSVNIAHSIESTEYIAPATNVVTALFGNPESVLPPQPPLPSINTNVPVFTSAEATTAPPPTFFNPNSMIPQDIAPQQNVNPFFAPPSETEPPKPVAEPPKMSGNLNYRMTKKRPQYYSGPIEGVGAISNNVKPTLPTDNAGNFHGAVFNPAQIQDQELVAPVEQASVSQTYAPFDISKPEPSFDSFNTAFDLSRQTTETYEEPKQETKGFGIIGSLKSKLGSLDINKIQNSVTTFFDPTFNDSQKDTYVHDYNKPVQGQQDNLGICIDQNVGSETYPPYNYQIQPYQYGENNHYYNTEEYSYQNQSEVYPSCTDFNQVPSQPTYDTTFSGALNVAVTGNVYHESVENNPPAEPKNMSDVPVATQTNVHHVEDSVLSANSSGQALILNRGETDLLAKQFFDTPSSIPDLIPKLEGMDLYSNIVSSEGDVKEDKLIREKGFIDLHKNEVPSTEPREDISIQGPNDSIDNAFDNFKFDDSKETETSKILAVTNPETVKASDAITPVTRQETESVILENAFANFTFDTDSNDKDLFATLKNNQTLNNEPLADSFTNVSSVPLFDLSTIIAAKSKDAELETELSDGVKNISLYELSKREPKQFDRDASVSFSDNDLENKPLLEDSQEEDSISEFNICETCREVKKTEVEEEKEVEDLTTQLIENIIAPIQLSNPVVVPLTEVNAPIDDGVIFDTEQCAEITHIAEEVIETIIGQSATKLLDDDRTDPTVNYGWCTDPNPSSIILEHDFTFQMNANTLGFIGDNSLFFDDIPCNASDEIKAEFKNSQDDTTVLPRQMSIPTAPPVSDDDSKSDETGVLDVHSIEQDAKNDFPLFEEFVIDPSETDDDKIEVRERERSSDDPIPDVDTFTNRVDRFKQMGEHTDIIDDVFDKKKVDVVTSISPAITIASYFDTGNYAADTHYRNSLSSLSPLSLINVNPPNVLTRIPPGFESEYQRRLSDLSDLGIVNIEPYIPDTSTQTRNTTTVSYTVAATAVRDTLPKMVDPIKLFSNLDVKEKVKEKLPPFATIFGVKDVATEQTAIAEESAAIGGLFGLHPVKMERGATIFGVKDVATEQTAIAEESVAIGGLFGLHPVKMERGATIFGVKDVATEQTAIAEESAAIGGLFGLHPVKMERGATIFGVKDVATEQTAIAEESAAIGGLFSLHPVKMEGGDATSVFSDKPPVKEPLPDPLSFFSSKEEPTEETDNSYNRLASYFATPATKTDPAKSFFELSQSQNHYRHVTNQSNLNLNIPSLIKDLTSPQNLTNLNKDQVIRTVNYFTVEYDSNINIDKLKTDEPSLRKDFKIDEPSKDKCQNETVVDANDDVIFLVKSCHDCCNLTNGDLCRKVMDNDSSDKKDKLMQPADREDNNMDDKRDVTLNFGSNGEANEGLAMLTENRQSMDYTPVRHHWFYRVDSEPKSIWKGFSLADSKALEDAFHNPNLDENTQVATDGGRYDVNIIGRLRVAVYWADKPTNVRRCSWFYKGNTDARYVPYSEAIAEKLEVEYRHGITTGDWHRRLELPNNELVVMHGPAVMVHLLQASADTFSATPLFSFGKRVYRNPPKIRVCTDQRSDVDHLIFLVHGAGEYGRQQERHQSAMRPRVVRRGWDESEIEDAEPSNIDHLLLLCHGVGSACDMRFRSVEEVVDDFRNTSLQLLQSHYRNSYDNGVVNRVEVLPISWHSSLHSGEAGVDRRLAEITLESIPRLRNFTNDTVLDVLFYTSPLYCQSIVNTVCAELNRIYRLFKSRNPSYSGRVSLGGHSLGSVILYDLLCHQNKSCETPTKRMVGGEVGGEGCPPIRYPTLDFNPAALYALGSPIAMFECIRGVDSLGDLFSLPTCANFFNIFHPYDPIAYRIEPLINRQLKDVKPFLIPHHKGRKRMHLELKETMARVGADIKQKLIESLKSTWTSMWKTATPPTDGQLEKVVEEEIEREPTNDDTKEEVQAEVTPELLGNLNAGRRVDYVLQEAPFEMINEYLFAMSSHVCYWESEDTMLLMLREIYDSLGIPPDCSVPQQSMTMQRHRTEIIEGDEGTYASATEPSTSRAGS